MFALLGFEQAVQLGGEARNPQRDLPRAVILSILIGATIYILLQIVFIGALSRTCWPVHGPWTNLGQPQHQLPPCRPQRGPVLHRDQARRAGLARVCPPPRRGDLAVRHRPALPTSSSRLSFGLSKNGYVPSAFEVIDQRTRCRCSAFSSPRSIGLLFLLPFPSWSELVDVVTSASVLMYAAAPLSLAALR